MGHVFAYIFINIETLHIAHKEIYNIICDCVHEAFYFDVFVDLHAVVRNNTEIPCTLYPVHSKHLAKQ